MSDYKDTPLNLLGALMLESIVAKVESEFTKFREPPSSGELDQFFGSRIWLEIEKALKSDTVKMFVALKDPSIGEVRHAFICGQIAVLETLLNLRDKMFDSQRRTRESQGA